MVFRRFHLDVAVMKLDDAVDHREADAGPMILRREIQVKDLGQVLRGDTNARVLDSNLDPVARRAAAWSPAFAKRKASGSRM